MTGGVWINVYHADAPLWTRPCHPSREAAAFAADVHGRHLRSRPIYRLHVVLKARAEAALTALWAAETGVG